MEKRVLEVCVDSVASALQAEKGGADRLELCADLAVGGVTPTLSLYERVRERVGIPVHVLLRPRFGDFLYGEEEFEVLRRQARAAREAGADALVIGCLTPEGRLCIEQMERLMEEVGGRPVTLHRAFDMCENLDRALEDAKRLGIHTILTSGGQASAEEGTETLARLQRAAGELVIMAGAGVGAGAIRNLRRDAALSAFHMSGKRIVKSRMRYRNPRVSMGLPQLSEYELWETDAEAVRQAKEALLRD